MSNIEQHFTVKYRRNYVAFLAVAFFFFIIVGEIVLATGIPLLMRNENLMSEEAARNELLLCFDQARIRCNAISGLDRNKKEDNAILLEKQLIANALDHFARYMRNEGNKLTPDEVTRIRKTVDTLHKAADRLANGESYSRANRLNTGSYVNSMLQNITGQDAKK